VTGWKICLVGSKERWSDEDDLISEADSFGPSTRPTSMRRYGTVKLPEAEFVRLASGCELGK
jgi:hypothetical protein